MRTTLALRDDTRVSARVSEDGAWFLEFENPRYSAVATVRMTRDQGRDLAVALARVHRQEDQEAAR